MWLSGLAVPWVLLKSLSVKHAALERQPWVGGLCLQNTSHECGRQALCASAGFCHSDLGLVGPLYLGKECT